MGERLEGRRHSDNIKVHYTINKDESSIEAVPRCIKYKEGREGEQIEETVSPPAPSHREARTATLPATENEGD